MGESKKRAPVIHSRGPGAPGPAVQLRSPSPRYKTWGLHGYTRILLLPRARELRPSPTSRRTPELLLGVAGTGEPRATPLVQWRTEDEVQGVASMSLSGWVGLPGSCKS